MAVEAKDIYNANTLTNANIIGYNVRDKNGELYVKKFVNILDNSLDLNKMRELYEKTYRRNNFTFNINHKDYTQTAICVKFSYAYKEFNRIGKNFYVKAGYDIKEIKFNDGVAIENGILVGINVNTEVEKPIDISMLSKYFIFESNMYQQKGVIKTLLTKAQLREYLYNNGFCCDGVKYVRFKRSSGSSRVGKCLFIDQALYSKFNKWNFCGLKIEDGYEIDLAAFEAYISLPSSSIIDTLTLSANNFLVIDDYESIFTDKVVGVKYENGKLVASEAEHKISNSIFDGESLLDVSLFEGKYADRGMLLLRNRFFKTAGFNTNIQRWFADNNITNVSQLNGYTTATDIKDIKIITTPSSIKYVKFAPLKQWFDNLDTTFGIVKHEKPTHYFDGRMVQCHYQLINTLQLSINDVSNLLKPNLHYISSVRNDAEILRYHIKYAYDKISDEPTSLSSKNEIVYKLMGINDKFSKTKLYYDFRNDLVKSMIRNLKQGHILINGTYTTLIGNGIEMLQSSIGTFTGKSILGTGNIHCSNFKYEETLLGSRSPHINSGNVLLAKNVDSEQINTYFNLSKEIVYINSIGENILQRLNGCDFDSDTTLLTDNPILIKAAQKNYHNFLVPTSIVGAKKVKRHYTDQDKADLDIKTSVNKIGEIVNFSQYLNSILWQRINNGESITDCKELYYDICKLAVLSGIEIDRSKKEYALSSTAVLNELKKKYQIHRDEYLIKPMFFKTISLENGYALNEKHLYEYFDTPMDHLYRQVIDFSFRKNRNSKNAFSPFYEIVEKVDLSVGGKLYYVKRDRIIGLVVDCKNKLSEIYCDYDTKSVEEKEIISLQASEIKQECVECINNLLISKTTMFLLLRVLDKKEYSYIARLIFTMLFGKPNMLFFEMIVNGSSKIMQLEENKYGTLQLFDYKFVKK